MEDKFDIRECSDEELLRVSGGSSEKVYTHFKCTRCCNADNWLGDYMGHARDCGWCNGVQTLVAEYTFLSS